MDSKQQYTQSFPSPGKRDRDSFHPNPLDGALCQAAQTTAANQATRVRERFQAELAALQKELKQKELALEATKHCLIKRIKNYG